MSDQNLRTRLSSWADSQEFFEMMKQAVENEKLPKVKVELMLKIMAHTTPKVSNIDASLNETDRHVINLILSSKDTDERD